MIIPYTDRCTISARAQKRLQGQYQVHPSFTLTKQLVHHLFRGANISHFDLLVLLAFKNIHTSYKFIFKEELKIYIQNRRAALKENPSRPLPLP